MNSHKTIYEDKSHITAVLPFTDSLRSFHKDGVFHLVEDPNVSKEATILGMFVLRPSHTAWNDAIIIEKDGKQLINDSIYDSKHQWSYNCKDVGWAIANKNSVDGYRLALHYAISDAVIMGSKTVSTEGVKRDDYPGHLWMSHILTSEWDQIKSIDSELEIKFIEQRRLWQKLGYLSDRPYPAQIVFTWSGDVYEGCSDFLSARMFHDKNPNGTIIEVYIVTGKEGAEKIRNRCHLFGLQDRIDSILIILPNKGDGIDIAILPKLLFDRFGMKIINHDGGQKILHEFCKAGVIAQTNLTMCRQLSVRSIVEQSLQAKEDVTIQDILKNFNSSNHYFFSSFTSEGTIVNSLPRCFKPVVILSDDNDEVAIITFYSKGADFFQM